MTTTPLIFLGAGASAPFGVPPMKEMVTLFEEELIEKGLDKQIALWNNVKAKLERVYGVGGVDIEHMLTFFSFPYIEPPSLSPNVIYHYGIDTKEQMEIVDTNTAKSIVGALKEFIYKRCDTQDHEDIFRIYSKLWTTIVQAPLRPPQQANILEFFMRTDLEIFTTNYDRCFEIFYRRARVKHGLRSPREIILDVGEKDRYYDFEYYTGDKPRLYKLHGSIRRYKTKTGRVRFYEGLRKEGEPVDGDEVVEEWMIWPLTGKYIYQYPYSMLMNKFRKTLYSRNSWLFVGFSFRDEGIKLILKEVNDSLEGQERRGVNVLNKNLILVDRSADEKRDQFRQYSKIHFWPITGEFGKDETFDKLREHAQTHNLFK